MDANNNELVSYKYLWKNVKTGGGGGFIPAIIFNESEKNLVFIRTDMGGVYRLDPSNWKWIPLTDWIGFDDWNYMGCESLATDSLEPNRLYVLAGTYTNGWAGNGAILKSIDKGDSFKVIELPFPTGGNMPGRSMGERLAIDPNDNSILFLGTHNGNGLWQSRDFGETWSKVESFKYVGNYKDPNFNDETGVVWVTFDSLTGSKGEATQTIYVGVADTKNSIYKTIDGGNTWFPLEGQPTLENQSSWTIIDEDTKEAIPCAFLPHHGILSSDGFLYITYSNNAGPYDGTKGDVWKYNTNTGEWTNVSPVPSSSDDNYFGYGGLAVDKNNPNIIMVTSLNSWWPDTKIYRSINGGNSWSELWSWDVYPNRKLNYVQDISKAPWLDWGVQKSMPEISPKLGWMTGGISIDPFNSDRMMYGTGATVYGSDNITNLDRGEKITIEVKADGIEEASVLTIISPPSGAHLLSGMADICGFYHDDLDKVPDKMMTTPNFNTVSMDYAELAPNFIVRSGNVNDSDKNTVKSCGFSYDGGKNWFQGDDISGIKGDAGGTIASAADGTTVLWSPSGNGNRAVCFSNNNGSSWIESKGIPNGAIIASDRVNPKKFYGFCNGKFYVSNDGGANFDVTGADNLPTTGSCKFKALPSVEGDIWLCGGSKDGAYGVWHSIDSGETFLKLSNVQEADTIGFGKKSGGKDYMSLYSNAKINDIRGIFRSDDEGKSWTRINDDYHQYGVANSDITGDPRVYGRVYLATNGRGVIYGDIQKTVNYGDINNDGDINVLDYTLLQRYLLGKTEDDINLQNSDLNQDNKVNSTDLMLLRKKIIGIKIEGD